MKSVVCINCGCVDLKACVDVFGDPCHWERFDARRGIGVCSQCPAVARLWDQLQPGGRIELRDVIHKAKHDARCKAAQICRDRGLEALVLELAA